MARNPMVPLTTDQLRNVCAHSEAVFTAITTGQTVTLHYVKRDGSLSSSTGIVQPVVMGEESTLSVIVDTADKGPRTINLSGVQSVQ